MAKISDSTLTTIFTLQRRLVELIDYAKTTEFQLLERFDETADTIPELEELQHATERLREPYARLHNLTLLVAESQPYASFAMLDLLAQTIQSSEVSANAVEASVQEIQRAWDLS